MTNEAIRIRQILSAIGGLFFSLLTVVGPLRAAETVRVGVLDQFMYDYYENRGLAEGEAFVLPLFQNVDGKWQVLETDLPEQLWTIAYDGKSLGQCSSRLLADQPLGGIHNLQESVREILHPDRALVKTVSGKRIHRPLALVSGGSFKDPDRWKRKPLPREMLAKLRQAFREQYPRVQNCSAESSQSRPWDYSDSAIQVLKSYGSREGNFIAEVELEGDLCGEILDDPFRSQYFGLPTKGEGCFMGLALGLIEACDFDGDGRSEFLFSDASQGGDDNNSDGYSLWNTDFKMVGQRVWFYH